MFTPSTFYCDGELIMVKLFILYSELQSTCVSDSTANFRGLGYVDSHKDVLEIKFELTNPLAPLSGSPTNSKRRKPRKPFLTANRTVEIEIYQDKTALHSRKGDTGSVLWKARFGTRKLHKPFVADWLHSVVSILHSSYFRTIIQIPCQAYSTSRFSIPKTSLNLGLLCPS